MRFALLEDNARSAKLLSNHLTTSGYIVDHCSTVDQFKDLIAVMSHDLYLIDLGLPDGDGLEVIRAMRRNRQCQAPILILSARSSISDRIAGLDTEADDYLCKPFHIDELLARLRALLRRPPIMQTRRLKAGSLILDCATGDVFFNNRRVDLSPSERQLLALLMRRAGHVVPKALIADTLRNIDQDITSNAIEKLVSRLRKSLDQQEMGVRLTTVRGSGYVLEELAKAS